MSIKFDRGAWTESRPGFLGAEIDKASTLLQAKDCFGPAHESASALCCVSGSSQCHFQGLTSRMWLQVAG